MTSPIGPLHVAALLVRARLRSLRNGVRLRARVRAPLLVAVAAVAVSAAYVGLFAQAFAVVVATVGREGQGAALGVVAGLLAFGSWAAKAATTEALRAGSPENEFLLSRPIGLGSLVAGRGIADALTDPMGALFLFPVLFAASLVWRLPATACLMAVAISGLVQLGISTLAYAAQVALVRLVPPPRRRGAWVAMRLVSALSLAALWMVGTAVLRDPAALAARLAAAPRWLSFTPGALIAAPLAAWASGAGAGAVLRALGWLAVAVGAAAALAVGIARSAGLGGWEGAGAAWAEAAAVPRRGGPITAASKDLRLIVRDRTQLMVLVAMPAIFVGVQIFGAAGWAWSTASLARVSCLSYSLALYMSTIGPLTHMQAERRAFWILRAVPVPLGRLLAAKARAWAAIVGATAAATFAALCFLMPAAPPSAVVVSGVLVAGGAVAMSFLAVAMSSGGADLSDDQSPAVGPGTVYAFLLVGGLYNLVLAGGAATRAAGLLLYLFTLAAYWSDGVARAEICFDAEAIRAPRLRVADGATLALIAALTGRGVASVAARARGSTLAAVLGLGVGARVALAAGGLHLLYRAGTSAVGRRWRLPALAIALAVAAGVSSGWALAGIAADEIIWRGVLQGSIERNLPQRVGGVLCARLLAGIVTLGLGAAALVLAGQTSAAALTALAVATAARTVSGRLSGALAARFALLLTQLARALFR
ncbi:MAG TPA: hypothetical protein VHH90_03380 [Polyangia bacterium]|nr:hypothetical protein [Polyangia bacterium]